MKTVLILEDDPQMLNHLSNGMKNDKWDIKTFRKVKHAYSYFCNQVDTQKKAPDLIIADLYMPPFFLRRLSAIVLEKLTFLLPLYEPASKIYRHKEWGGLMFLRSANHYVLKKSKNSSDNRIRMSKIIVFSKYPNLLITTNKYIQNLIKDITKELIERVGVEKKYIFPKFDVSQIVSCANKIVTYEES